MAEPARADLGQPREEGTSSPHTVPNDLLTLYLIQIRTVPLLSADDEQRLGLVMQQGRTAAAALADGNHRLSASHEAELAAAVRAAESASEQFVRANLALVVSVAKRYRASGLPLLDLIQEGHIGLLRAVERYDHTRGVRFSTYGTWWIRQTIEAGVARGAGVVALPARVRRRRACLFATRARLEVELGRVPTEAEVAAALGITAMELTELLGLPEHLVPLSHSVSQRGNTPGDIVADTSAPSPEEEAARSLLGTEVRALVAQLDEREREILRLRYGLGEERPRTLREVAHAFDLTPERIRQLEARALERLRRVGGLLRSY